MDMARHALRLLGRRVRGVRPEFCEAKEARELRDQLYAWYNEHAFPTYQPEMESVTTVSGAIECAVSVGNYMKATGYEMSDPGPFGALRGCHGRDCGEGGRVAEHPLRFEEAPAEEPKEEVALGDNDNSGTA